MEGVRALVASILGIVALAAIARGVFLMSATSAFGGADALHLKWLQGAVLFGTGLMTLAVVAMGALRKN